MQKRKLNLFTWRNFTWTLALVFLAVKLSPLYMAWQYPHVARHAVMPGQQTPVKQCAGVMAVNAIAEIVEVRILPIICSCILLFGLLGIVVMASLSPLALVLSRIPKLCSLTNLRLAALGSFRL